AGSPLPTPNFNFATGVFQTTSIQVSQILTSCSPSPSILIVGRVNNATTNGIFGTLTGAPVAISIGYTTDNPPKINNIAYVIAGVATTYSASGSGTLTFPAATSGGGSGGGTGTGPTIVVKTSNGTTIASSSVTQVATSPFILDASSSTGNGALTYSFATSSANAPVAFVNTGTNGVYQVQFPAAGDYVITLTVTDASGNKSSFTFTLEYTGRPQ
ncbi:MAG TPA: hypothetical protein VFA78_00295, partial [Chloroflexota bacterium]|nr:hypothetical protein [Chloroflexota bacterium]